MAHTLESDSTVPQLDDGEQLRQQALDMAAHDLLNRVTTILSVSELLKLQLLKKRRGITRTVVLDRLEAISTLGRYMSSEVDALLELARHAPGSFDVQQRKPVDLVALARRIAAEQQAATQRHLIQVTCGAPILIAVCDERGIASVLTNLVDNAIKYSPDGGPITIALAGLPTSQGNWTQIQVDDTGIGIPDEEQEYVFRRFYRASNAAARIPGTGLGLAGVRSIIEQHGGEALLESTLGKGTTVRLRFPLIPCTDG
jgi:signal transduction histidine kinase